MASVTPLHSLKNSLRNHLEHQLADQLVLHAQATKQLSDALSPVGQPVDTIAFMVRSLAFADSAFALEIEAALLQFGAQAIPALVNALQDSDVKIAASATTVLFRLGQVAEPQVISAYQQLPAESNLRHSFDYLFNLMVINPQHYPQRPKLALV